MTYNESDFELIKKLTETPGIAGHEDDIRKLIYDEIKDYCDKIIVDKLGNLICLKKGVDNGPKIMIAAHMDTIGFMVKYIDKNGFIRIEPVGGIDSRITIGQSVIIFHNKERINGVIAAKPIHLLDLEERNKVKKINELHLDIGAKSKEDAENLVSIGDFLTFNYKFKRLANTVFTSGGLDDRAGCMVLIQTLKSLKDVKHLNDLYFVFCSQEEIGTRGAIPSAFRINPDIGFVCEVTHAIDFPEIKKEKYGDIKLGGGPVIDMGPNINPKLFKKIVKIAKDKNIPFQLKVSGRPTPTDLRSIQMTHEGVATALISIPLRYMHTTIEVMDLEDINSTISLFTKLLPMLKKDIDLKL
ncbi:MAG: M42 family metallopeptidase [Candidatus Helarchaeota archaeon]